MISAELSDSAMQPVAGGWRNSFRFWSLATSLAFGLLVIGLCVLDHGLYDAMRQFLSKVPSETSFNDLQSVLLNIDCARRGGDPYVVISAGQSVGRSSSQLCGDYNYSPLLLKLAWLPVTAAWLNPLGLAMGAAFYWSVSTLPVAGRRRDITFMVAATLSNMVLFAILPANLDVVLFIGTLAAALLLAGGRFGQRLLGYGLVLVLTLGAKLYSAVLLAMAIRERPAICIGISLACGVVILVFIGHYHAALTRVVATLPSGKFISQWWGAVDLPFGIGALLNSGTPARSGSVSRLLPYVIYGLLTLRALLVAVRLAGRGEVVSACRNLGARERSLLFAGMLVIVGCFFAWQNLPYRGIYFLLILPPVLQMRPVERGGILSLLPWLILFLMWSQVPWLLIIAAGEAAHAPDGVRFMLAFGFWFLRELVWWQVIGSLIGLLICLVGEAPLVRMLWPAAAGVR